jgi:UDP-glucuronate 4-epimerase
MAMFIFADAILKEKPFRLFNNGNMLRDFTYIADIVESIVRLCENPAKSNNEWNPYSPETCSSSSPFKIYNIGNNSPVRVGDLVSLMETILGKKAKIINDTIQPGDVSETYADVHRLANSVNFKPATPIEIGLKKFLSWYREYYSI